MFNEKKLVNDLIKETLNNLERYKQLQCIKLAIDSICEIEEIINNKDIILSHRTKCYIESEKSGIELYTNKELIEEISKRLSNSFGSPRA